MLIPYLISPVYDFPDKTIFSGKNLHNPYENLGTSNWYKANFHSHSNVWFGLTRGKNSSADTIIHVYKLLGYDVMGISNYMKILNLYNDSISLIPAYEHGYGLFKIHYLVIGSENVNFLDFFLIQTLSNKQFLLKILKKPENIVAIVHPNMYNAFSEQDFEYLTDYDCVEILRYDRVSTKYWDAALSAGHLKYLIANDDLHDVTAPYETGRCFTMINSATKNKDQIINSIKEGKAYAIDWRATMFDSLGIKLMKLNEIPSLQFCKLKGDTIIVKVSKKAKEIKFIGQYGVVNKIVNDSDSGFYNVNNNDSYVRTEITYYDSTKMYLNPVIRYEDMFPPQKEHAKVDILKTVINKLFYIFIIIAVSLAIRYVKYRRGD
ncbi:MAG: hypothetical protein N2490_08900 [Ignavibacteria bacterium]|nr:hypothetical protein [Ignavibacteria bacterium]